MHVYVHTFVCINIYMPDMCVHVYMCVYIYIYVFKYIFLIYTLKFIYFLHIKVLDDSQVRKIYPQVRKTEAR